MRFSEHKYFGKTRLEKRANKKMLSLNLFFIGIIVYNKNISFLKLI